MSSYFLLIKENVEKIFPGYYVDNFINKSLPVISNGSYLLHSTKFLTPALFSQVCGKNSLSISRALLINAVAGNMWYIFTRRHMRELELTDALLYSTIGSFLFNFGSILFWSLGRYYLPENSATLLAFGFLSSAALLAQGQAYLNFVDSKFI